MDRFLAVKSPLTKFVTLRNSVGGAYDRNYTKMTTIVKYDSHSLQMHLQGWFMVEVGRQFDDKQFN